MSFSSVPSYLQCVFRFVLTDCSVSLLPDSLGCVFCMFCCVLFVCLFVYVPKVFFFPGLLINLVATGAGGGFGRGVSNAL